MQFNTIGIALFMAIGESSITANLFYAKKFALGETSGAEEARETKISYAYVQGSGLNYDIDYFHVTHMDADEIRRGFNYRVRKLKRARGNHCNP